MLKAPRIRINSAKTTKVYGRLSAIRTNHIISLVPAPRRLSGAHSCGRSFSLVRLARIFQRPFTKVPDPGGISQYWSPESVFSRKLQCRRLHPVPARPCRGPSGDSPRPAASGSTSPRRIGPDQGLNNCSSIAGAICSGTTAGPYRATTCPSRAHRNLVKFHKIRPPVSHPRPPRRRRLRK